MWIVADLVYDTDAEAREAERLAREGKLTGVSVDMAVVDAEIEIRETDQDGFPTDWLETVTRAEIIGATQVPMPAFADAHIEFTDGGAQVWLAPEGIETSDRRMISQGALEWRDPAPFMFIDRTTPGHDDAVFVGNLTNFRRVGSLVASGWSPEPEVFRIPEPERPTPVTITEDGRIYGHLGAWSSCHLDFGECVAPPRSDGSYAHFHTGTVDCGGESIPVGVLTAYGGHAGTELTASKAKAHYDDISTAFAYVHIIDGNLGPWMSGMLKPGVDPDLVAEVKANGKLSGDWRVFNGQRELIAVHAVNVAGFQLPRIRALVAGGSPSTLITTVDVVEYRETLEDRLARLEVRSAAQDLLDALA